MSFTLTGLVFDGDRVGVSFTVDYGGFSVDEIEVTYWHKPGECDEIAISFDLLNDGVVDQMAAVARRELTLRGYTPSPENPA